MSLSSSSADFVKHKASAGNPVQPLVLTLAEDCYTLESRQSDLTGALVELMARQQVIAEQVAELEKRRKQAEDEAIYDAEIAGKEGPLGGLAKSSEGYAAKVNLIRRQASAHIRPMLEELQRKAMQLDGQRAQLELDLKATHYVMRNRVAQLHALAAVAAPTGSAVPLADF